MSAMSWSIYVTVSSIAVVMATSSFGCSDTPRLSGSRQRNLLMGYSHRFYQGTVLGLSLGGHAYRNMKARSYALCSVYCMLSDKCKSFNYCMDGKLCQLNSAVYSENEDTLMESSDCLYFDESLHEALPCQMYATIAETIKFKKVMAVPVHLEFVVVSDDKVDVDFWANGRDFEVDLDSTQSIIKEEFEGRSLVSTKKNKNLWATPVVVDYNNTHITVGQKGVPESQFSLKFKPNNADSMNVRIEGHGNANWTFYSPCEVRFV